MRSKLEIGWRKGIVVKDQENRLVFDPVAKSCIHKGDLIFISHSHADHSLGFTISGIKYSTEESKRIFERIRDKNVDNFVPVKVNQTIDLGSLKVTPLNAGHMLGSVQYKIESPNSSVLYTGDINCVDTLISEKADEVECDTLIIEATFGNPAYIFPRREKVYSEIIKWTLERINDGKIPIFHVYAAGKAQELIKIFNSFTNLDILTHPRISKINKVYSEEGISLEFLDISDESTEVIKEKSCICITYPTDKELNFENGAEAVATGWTTRKVFNSSTAFPLSGHADFKQLIRFVEKTGARTVYVYTGFKDSFASYLSNKLGIEARALPNLPKKNIEDFLFEGKMSKQA